MTPKNYYVAHGALEPTCDEPGIAARTSACLCPFCRVPIVPSGVESAEHCAGCGRDVFLLPTAHVDAATLAVPLYYGHYRAVRFAGRGGMGIVMNGVDEAIGEPVAIKVLIECDRGRQRSIARFHREVAALRSISHPNIVRLIGHGTIGNQRFLVMEWVDGPNFRELIEAFRCRRELPQFQVVNQWLIQACSGLAAIHAAGVVHRDIKPSNLMLDRTQRLRIADFGIACTATESATPSAASGVATVAKLPARSINSPFELPLTAAGEFTGTADYMAPECFQSAFHASPRSDLYSLGISFYEISTGERPLISWPAPSALNRSLPELFDGVIMKLLAKNPADRFAAASELVSILGGRGRAI